MIDLLAVKSRRLEAQRDSVLLCEDWANVFALSKIKPFQVFSCENLIFLNVLKLRIQSVYHDTRERPSSLKKKSLRASLAWC